MVPLCTEISLTNLYDYKLNSRKVNSGMLQICQENII